MTDFYLHGGNISAQLYDHTIDRLLLETNATNLLVFVDHYSGDINESWQRVSSNLSLPTTRYQPGIDLTPFDGVYVAGGDEQALLSQLRQLGYQEVIALIISSKVYLGTSAGAMILGRQYYAWGHDDNPFRLGLKDDGLGIFPDTLIEVHYQEVGFQSRLHHSLEYEPTISHGLGINEGSVILVKDSDITKAKFILGNGEILSKS